MRLRDEREVRIRPTRTTDARAMQELFFRLTEEDVRSRFFQKLTSLTDSVAQHLCSVSYDDEMAFAAVVGLRESERIVATSCYYLDPATGLANVAYLVDPEWQGSGLGTILHERTVEYARRTASAASRRTCSRRTRPCCGSSSVVPTSSLPRCPAGATR